MSWLDVDKKNFFWGTIFFYSVHNFMSLFHYIQHNNHHELTKDILQGTKNHTLKYNLDHRLSHFRKGTIV